MVLAVPELEQPIRGHRTVAAGRGAIQPHLLRVQIVHPQQMSIQRHLKIIPGGILAQGTQHLRQAVIAEVQAAHRLAGAAAQRLQTLLSPGLNVVQAVVALRKDMGQPDGGRPAQAEALPVAVGGEEFVQQGRYPHPLHLGQQQGNIIYPFVRHTRSLAHSKSLLQFPKPVQI